MLKKHLLSVTPFLIGLIIAGFIAFARNKPSSYQPSSDNTFYLAENGITVMCPEAEFGTSGTVNGITYIKRNRDQITPSNAATTCTSGITDMNSLFVKATSFNKDISSWDVSNVTDMSYMFDHALSFNQDIGHWDVSHVTNMEGMFASAISFNQPIGNWDVGSVTNMAKMFSRSRWLEEGQLMQFNQPIGAWDVSNVTNMSGMFKRADFFN